MNRQQRLPVIVGLDALGPRLDAIKTLVSETCSLVTGYKVGLPNLLPQTPRIHEAKALCPGSLWIADLKLADIDDTMRRVASTVTPWADAVIAHAFPGIEGALGGLKDLLDREGKKLILVVAMSNPGARETMDPLLPVLVGIARRLGAWGMVAPATRPGVIREARRLYPSAAILAPGVGAQGARPGEAIRAGANLEIIGRMITLSGDPRGVLQGLAQAYRQGGVESSE